MYMASPTLDFLCSIFPLTLAGLVLGRCSWLLWSHTVKWSSDQQVDPGPKQFRESCWDILGTGGRDSLDNHCIFLWVGVMKLAAPQLLLHRIPFPLFMNFLGGYPWSTLCQCGDLVPPARGHSSPTTSDRSGWSCR